MTKRKCSITMYVGTLPTKKCRIPASQSKWYFHLCITFQMQHQRAV